MQSSNPNPNAKTVDLAELTSRLGRPAHEQQAVAAFADSPGPWTEAEAGIVEHVWANTDDETGIYAEPGPDMDALAEQAAQEAAMEGYWIKGLISL